MIEVLNIPPRHLKGTNDKGNYDFYIQKARIKSVDRDGIETTDVIEIQSNPGEVYEPGDDYLIDPTCVYVGNVQGRDGRNRKRPMLGQLRLVRLADLVARNSKPALKAA
ncbi:hypothetical protein M527_16020 [Sphingobium indicum IP26]|uniref:Uncharacterized protein n=1 Tax=Sphingobium indicum F2 TaxID=1450518 RepID=A0A8E0WUD4_9SPHN|nr:hypothetical protein [Sphingobium indicum]EPR17566.1 hypothetical protein M527_16020 [Sphingobium indicum IP26]KER37637.1 hypothetical protein AL00_04300 [Sphingobium indicum F2]